MIINPHTGEIDDSFLTEIPFVSFPHLRIQDAGDSFLIEYFFDEDDSDDVWVDTGLITILKDSFELYNNILISRAYSEWDLPSLHIDLHDDVYYVGG